MSQFTIPWREAPLDGNGNWSQPWVIFLNELTNRLGGIGDERDLGESNALLDLTKALLDYQSFLPLDARIGDALRRIEEVAGMVPSPPNLSEIYRKLEDLEGMLVDIRPTQSTAQEAWAAPTLTNSWANFGTPYNSAGYWKDTAGVVHLRGAIKSGTISAPAFTLPAGYRPANTEGLPALSNNALGVLLIDNAGGVTPAAGSNASFFLDGITFRAA